MLNFKAHLSIALLLLCVIQARAEDPGASPQATNPTPNDVIGLNPKVACPAFNMAQYGGSPCIWYAPFCRGDSGAVAMVLPPGVEGCACESDPPCIGDYTKFDGSLAEKLWDDGYQTFTNKPVAHGQQLIISHLGSEFVTQKGQLIRFKTEDGAVRIATVVALTVKSHLANVPLSAFRTDLGDSGNTIISYRIESFEAIIGYEVSGDVALAIDVELVKKLGDKAYRVKVGGRDADVLLHSKR